MRHIAFNTHSAYSMAKRVSEASHLSIIQYHLKIFLILSD